MKKGEDPVLLCAYKLCKQLLEKPLRLVCCGKSICEKHLKDLLISNDIKENKKYKCTFCKEDFSYPIENNTDNPVRVLTNILNIDYIRENRRANEFLAELEETINRFKDLQLDSFVFNHFNELRNQVDLKREEEKQAIDIYYEKLIKKINEYELECANVKIQKEIENIKKEVDLYERKHAAWVQDVKSLTNETSSLQTISQSISDSILELRMKSEKYKYILLNNKIFTFEKASPTTNDYESILGKFIVKTDTPSKNKYDYQQGYEFDLLTISNDNFIKVWNSNHDECIKSFPVNSDSIITILLLSNNRLLVSLIERSIKLINSANGECIRTFHNEQANACYLTKISSEEFIGGYENGEVKMWNIKNNVSVKSFSGCDDQILCLEMIDNKELIALCVKKDKNYDVYLGVYMVNYSEIIKVWNLDSTEIKRTINCKSLELSLFRCLPNCTDIIVCSNLNKIRKCNMETGEFSFLFQTYFYSIKSMELLNGHKLVTLSEDKSIRIWDLNTNNCLMILNELDEDDDDDDDLNSTVQFKLNAFSEEKILTHMGGKIKIWDLNCGKCLKTIDNQKSFELIRRENQEF